MSTAYEGNCALKDRLLEVEIWQEVNNFSITDERESTFYFSKENICKVFYCNNLRYNGQIFSEQFSMKKYKINFTLIKIRLFKSPKNKFLIYSSISQEDKHFSHKHEISIYRYSYSFNKYLCTYCMQSIWGY